jgi:DNA-binding CsgD family transcriptional regulator
MLTTQTAETHEPGAVGCYPGAWASLTSAECRVINLVAEGLTNREVATRLFISPHTVSTHLKAAYPKLGVRSRVQATRVALRCRDDKASRSDELAVA